MDVEAPEGEPGKLHPETHQIEFLSDNNFLRRLPRGLDARQRHELEAVLLAADCIAISLQRMLRLGLTVANDPGPLSTLTRTELFSAAWSIVDNLSVVQQLLLRATKSQGPKTDALMNKLAVVRKVRNWRQHMKAGLDGAINQKRRQWPIFGAISFVVVPPCGETRGTNEPVTARAMGFIILAGSVGGAEGRDWIRAIDPIGAAFERPITGPFFLVKDHEIDLLALYRAVHQCLEVASEHIETSCRSQAEKHSAEQGVSLGDLLDPLPVIDIRYDLECDSPGLG